MAAQAPRDGRTDAPGRRDGRTARPCPGRRPAPSCCCQRPAGQGPAQVRPRAFRLARLPRPSVRRSPLSIPSPWFRRAALPCTGTLTPGPCRGEGRVQQGRWEGLRVPGAPRTPIVCTGAADLGAPRPAGTSALLMPKGCSEQRLVLEGGAGRVPAPVGAGARRPWGRWGGGVCRPASLERLGQQWWRLRAAA